MRDVPTSPHFDLPRIGGCIPALLDAFLTARALMEDSRIAVVGLPDDLVSPDDEGLFAFIRTLRVAVKARVTAEQKLGRPLSEIVAQVREMVRVAEEDAPRPKPFPSHAYKAISRQAVAWCVEAYRPQFFAAADKLAAERGAHAPQPPAADVALTGSVTDLIESQPST